MRILWGLPRGDSGTALSYKFYGKQQALKDTARASERLERQVVEFFGLFISKKIEYSVVYDDKFSPSLDEANIRLETINTVLSMNMGDTVRVQLYRDTVALMSTVNNWDEKTTSQALEDVASLEEIQENSLNV